MVLTASRNRSLPPSVQPLALAGAPTDDRDELVAAQFDAPRRRRMQLSVGGVPLDLLSHTDLFQAIRFRLERRPGPAIAIASVNLDHVRHFGRLRRAQSGLPTSTPAMRWLHIADGWPAGSRASKLAGERWPMLPGSDILPDVFALAADMQASVGIVGGTASSHGALADYLSAAYPTLNIAGMWSPTRAVVDDERRSIELADQIALASVDILVVGLGKPRQELWVAHYGERTGAVVFLPFGAATDFMSGVIARAPRRIRKLKLEWAWRLVQEPRRLARRYLVEAPAALWALRRATIVSASAPVSLASPEHQRLAEAAELAALTRNATSFAERQDEPAAGQRSS